MSQIAADRVGNVYLLADDTPAKTKWVRRVRPDGNIETVPHDAKAPRFEALSIATAGSDSLLVLGTSGLTRVELDGSSSSVESTSPRTFFLGAGSRMAASPSGHTYFANDFHVGGAGVGTRAPDGTLSHLLSLRRANNDEGDGGHPRDATIGCSVGAIATDSQGNVCVSDGTNSVIRRINSPHLCPRVNRPRIGGVTDASFYDDVFAPNTVFSIWGSGLGPTDGLTATPNAAGRFPTELAGVQVLVNGRVARLLYVSDTQINAISPSMLEVSGLYFVSRRGEVEFSGALRRYYISVVREGVDSDPVMFNLAPAAPAFLLLADEQAAALNQDGSVNGPDQPARPGSVVALYMSGGGVMSPAVDDGAIVRDVLPQVTEEVVVLIDGQEVEALYAGGAPGLVNGVMQSNFRVPDNLTQSGRIEIEVQVGLDRSARSAYLHVR